MDMKNALPEADVYVYDNNSEDNTAAEAENAGAIVRMEPYQGKGCVVRSMFRDIDADVYLMIDGDGTYPADRAMDIIAPVLSGESDMVVGDRLSNGSYYKENRRSFHNFGNDMFTKFINRFFNARLSDIMSGYRAFSKRFVKSFPVISNGFQLETEMTIFALNYNFHIKEIPVRFTERPQGSFSKLNTVSDGWKVLMCIMNMYRHYKPLQFFALISLFFIVAGIAIGVPTIIEFILTHYVTRVPSAILASGLVTVALLLFVCGLILDAAGKNSRLEVELRIKEIN